MNRGILPVFLVVVAVVVLVGYLVVPRWVCSSGDTPPRAEEETGEPVEEDAGTPPARPDRPSSRRADAGGPTHEGGALPTVDAADAGVARPVGTGVLAGLVLDRGQSHAVGAIVTVRLDVGDEPWRPHRGGFERPEPGIATARVGWTASSTSRGCRRRQSPSRRRARAWFARSGADRFRSTARRGSNSCSTRASISGRVTDERNSRSRAPRWLRDEGRGRVFRVTARDGNTSRAGYGG